MVLGAGLELLRAFGALDLGARGTDLVAVLVRAAGAALADGGVYLVAEPFLTLRIARE